MAEAAGNSEAPVVDLTIEDDSAPQQQQQSSSSSSSPPTERFTLLVDVRERDLIEELTKLSVPHTVRALPVFDVWICDATLQDNDSDTSIAGHGSPVLLVECKTGDDYAASMASDRYRSQKARAMSVPSAVRLLYLVVRADGGNTLYTHPTARGLGGYASIPNTAVLSAQLNCVWRDDVHVWTVGHMAYAAEVLRRLLNKCSEHDPATVARGESPEARAARGTAALSGVRQSNVLGAKRGRNITPATYYRDSLAAVPGVGTARADAIVARWPSLPALIKQLQGDARALRVLPKFGAVLAQRVHDFVLTTDDSDDVAAAAKPKNKKQKTVHSNATTAAMSNEGSVLPTVVSSSSANTG
jgi:ERCC4-type nuclease